jgi:hypothetical protein
MKKLTKGGSRILFNTDFTNTDLQHKIIEIYDLKTAGMIDQKVKYKFLKNKHFIEQMLRQENEDRTIYHLHQNQIINNNHFSSSTLPMQSIKTNILTKFGGIIKQETTKDLVVDTWLKIDPSGDNQYLLDKYGYSL